MAKRFVLDTNVLIHEAGSIFKFEDNHLFIPIVVLEELDNFKKAQHEVGFNAREVTRHLNELMVDGAILSQGVALPGGGTLTVVLPQTYTANWPEDLDKNVNDHKILNCAMTLDATLVTKDVNLRVKANALGVPAEDYQNDKVSLDTLHCGHRDSIIPTNVFDQLYATKAASKGDVLNGEDFLLDRGVELPAVAMDDYNYPNQCVMFTDAGNPNRTALARYYRPKREFQILNCKNVKPMGLVPRNREQQYALSLLLDPSVKLVTLVGKAGTGKTLLAVAAGLHLAMNGGPYTKVLVTRPVIPMGRDIGFLPGDINEKILPWMGPIYDNIEFLWHGDEDDQPAEKKVAKLPAAEELKLRGYLEVGALTYIRGRSIPKQYIIVDEAQNLTPHEVKTILTRAGEGSKIVLTGDPFQIDNPYVDANSNGLTYAAQRFKWQDIAGHITMTKGERSELAELAAELL